MLNDFRSIAAAALVNGRRLVQSWIPGGRFEGHEYTVKNPLRNDKTAGSFRINTRTGEWADFATNDKGGDLVSLYAYINQLKQSDAAREVAAILGSRI